MPPFRTALAASDPTPITAAAVRSACRTATRLSNFFLAPPLRLVAEHRAEEEVFWEVFQGRLLDGTQTRERRRFEAWNMHLIDGEASGSAEPIVAIKYDEPAGRLHVTRAILCHAHETYDAGDNILLSREVQRWQRELVGTIVLADLPDAGALLDELACRLFQAVVGTSRLPLTSVETPLPGFSLGQFGYVFGPSPADEPVSSPRDVFQFAGVDLADAERVKLLELSLRATPADGVAGLAGEHIGREPSAADVLVRLQDVFNGVTLSPYTDFATKAFAFVRRIAEPGAIGEGDRVDFLCHLSRQLFRHLTAYDLVTFHHRGANYPDALLLDDVLAELLPLAADRPDLFAGDDRLGRLRRRAVRHGILLRLEYASHAVPDAPTSPGENLRVLPAPFVRVPDDQIHSSVTRSRQLFTDDAWPDIDFIRACLRDLDRSDELQELGTALFLDRPLGFAKLPGEPDQTWLASHVMFSRSRAEARLRRLAGRPEWHPGPGSVERWTEQVRSLAVNGLPLRNAGAPPRPGVVSLHDALRVADDWLLLQTTRRSLNDFFRQSDRLPMGERECRLLIPGGTEREPTLCGYDQNLDLRFEVAPDFTAGYVTRGGMEYPRAGLRVVLA